MTEQLYGGPRRDVLRVLRQLIPQRPLGFSESLRIAELQAARLLELQDVTDGPVPDDVVLSLPRIHRRYYQLRAASGMTYWNGSSWIIGINSTEPVTRQRFTLLHEFKHIIDHGQVNQLYPRNNERAAEQAADYFAGCVLMPKRLLTKAWYSGMQRASELAKHFEVSERAVEVRLSQLGILSSVVVERRPSATSPLPERPSKWYFRSTSTIPTTAKVAPCPK